MSTDVLAQPTLVLNRQWQPVHVSSVARALDPALERRGSGGRSRPIPADVVGRLGPVRAGRGAPCVRSARLRLKVPEVICLAHFDRLPSTSVTFSRRNVAKRDHYTCQYCGSQPGAESITIDHILPRSQGGAIELDQLCGCLFGCNARKGDRTPEQAGCVCARRPVRPDWKPFYAAQGVRIESWARFLSPEPALALA